MKYNRLVGVISLGCDKNRVDTEVMLHALTVGGYSFTGNIAEADIILINTCAFINAARQEAIDAILEATAYKQDKCRCVVVAGCLTQKYLHELTLELPDVDVWLTIEERERIAERLAEFFGDTLERPASPVDRQLTTPAHYAYLRIADGCSNHCTFCTIPSIRGAYRSVDSAAVLDEARRLVSRGAKELIVIAQDVTSYGKDLPQNVDLVGLIRLLSTIEGLSMIRLMYCYPENITDQLILEIATNNKLVKYIDIPFQHADNRILKTMNRRTTFDSGLALVKALRAACPSIAIRSTFMVGFPGETQEAFDTLVTFLKQARLDHVGFFAYSLEKDTPSARLAGRVPYKLKMQRLKAARAVQSQIVADKQLGLIGTTVDVIYEDIDYGRQRFVGRMLNCAPDIDPKVYFSAKSVDVGEVYPVRILKAERGNLVGVVETI